MIKDWHHIRLKLNLVLLTVWHLSVSKVLCYCLRWKCLTRDIPYLFFVKTRLWYESKWMSYVILFVGKKNQITFSFAILLLIKFLGEKLNRRVLSLSILRKLSFPASFLFRRWDRIIFFTEYNLVFRYLLWTFPPSTIFSSGIMNNLSSSTF